MAGNTISYKMKVAVALACLRQKPDGMSGQEYARQLCDQFQTCQLQLKHQLENKEREMLHLKQQLAVYQHQQGQSQAVQDSCSSNSQSLFPTPPPSGSLNMLDCEISSHLETSTSLTRHVGFLHHVMTLQTGAKLIADKGIDKLVHNSLMHSLGLLKEMHDGNTFVWRLQNQCVECLDRLLKQVSPQFRAELVTKTGIVAGEIIQRLASDQTLNTKVRTQQSGLIIHIANNSEVIVKVLEHLIAAIHRFSDHLRETLTSLSNLDPRYYSNMYLIMDTTDRCLICQSASLLDRERREEFVQRLEDSVIHLSDRFPLFTLAVWRLCCKLSS